MLNVQWDVQHRTQDYNIEHKNKVRKLPCGKENTKRQYTDNYKIDIMFNKIIIRTLDWIIQLKNMKRSLPV